MRAPCDRLGSATAEPPKFLPGAVAGRDESLADVVPRPWGAPPDIETQAGRPSRPPRRTAGGSGNRSWVMIARGGLCVRLMVLLLRGEDTPSTLWRQRRGGNIQRASKSQPPTDKVALITCQWGYIIWSRQISVSKKRPTSTRY